MKLLMKNKKADFPSIIVMIAIIFALSLGAIIFSRVFLSITNELKDETKFSNNTIETIEKVESKTIPFLDLFIFIFLIGSFLGIIISSIYVDVHPAIVVIFIIMSVVAIILAGIFTNVYAEATETDELTSTASQFKLTNLILGQHFPVIIFVISIVVIVILYGKSRRVSEV